ncbi:hypothetical protein GCK72_021568 [Caenorhabditis remanei]|uniref:DUF19 domain-containing protein n=1 Tax=Caenorhabditis remanei TaxID=31234 RepID=A0A6A5GK75_CAERE|nr:hypothetical protein GCK72_021568 [Caenorhabditis remanei]KAF1755001.1 hypothetical protein GCK72_021568 [Caenorhabditis remanei]
MHLLPSILILSCILLHIGADFRPCPYMTPECRSKMLELRSLLTFFPDLYYPPPLDMYNLTKLLCQETESCLSRCGALEDYRNACESFGTQVHQFESLCVKGALEDTDPLLKKKVFTEGKGCFLNISDLHDCKTYMPLKYDILMSQYLTPSEDGKCNTPYDKFQKFQCEVLLWKFDLTIKTMYDKNSLNATMLAEMAQRSQNCIDNTCLMKPMKTGKMMKLFNKTSF